tara:strand:- start:2233 stop:2496 length:264 start_codon:yes stop_codon:yes gene_type:complete
MYRILNISLFILIIIFISVIIKYYSSNKNINIKKYNRTNIDQILKEKVSNLPILENDTSNIIEFNDSFDNEMGREKKRSFWDLIKNK